MPGFNGKGPLGEGSQTGRKLGKCGGENRETIQTTEETYRRRGFRFRFQSSETDEMRGQGRGWKAGFRGRRSGRPGQGMRNRFGNR
jgi:hypothetical protein